MNEFKILISDIQIFKFKLVEWLKIFDHFAVLDSNGFSVNYPYYDKVSSYDLLAAAGNTHILKSFYDNSFENLKFIENTNKWWFGFIGYDCKNNIENLKSSNPDFIQFFDLYFFSPEIIFIVKNNILRIISPNLNSYELYLIYKDINNIIIKYEDYFMNNSYIVRQRINKNKYYQKTFELSKYIHSGYIYEINFCIEFFVEQFIDDPIKIFYHLNKISPAPFSCFYRLKNVYIISASPERFLKKFNDIVISQPMKGTIKRGENGIKDIINKNILKNSLKDRTENIMTVDIVRNDLSRYEKSKKVEVAELCGVYTFSYVHQMISTVKAEIEAGSSISDIIKSVFPMASMTGAPKIKAMELIDEFEETKRGIFSGAAGYVDSQNNFDFNVIIRSMIYNSSNKYLSFSTGSAITAMSNINDEYEECLLKAKPLIKVISQTDNVKQI